MEANRKFGISILLSLAFILLKLQMPAQMINLSGGDSSHACKIEIGAIVLQNSIHNKMVYGADGEFVKANSYGSGLVLRVHSKKVAWRLALGGYEEDYDFEPSSTNFLSNEGGFTIDPIFVFEPQILNSVLRKTLEAKLGLQVNLFNARLSSYFFSDLGYRMVRESRYYTYTTTLNNTETIHNVPEHAFAHYTALHTGIGLRYQFSKSLYAAYECSAIAGVMTRGSDRKGRVADSVPMINYMPAQFMFGIYF